MNVQLIDCPACGNKVSSQAAACPKCGQPIRPTLRLAEKQPAPAPQTAVSSTVSNGQPLNIENGLKTVVGMAVIIALLVFNLPALMDDYSNNDGGEVFLVLLALTGYLFLWGWNAFIALKHKDTGKIVILTFLPFIGILFCSFLMPKDNNSKKEL